MTSDYYGVTDDFAERVANITCLIFKAFVGRQPVQADVVAVATSISNDAVDESHEREIAKEKLDLLLYAFEQACNAGNPGSWNYVNGVLGRLAQRGIRTLADAEQYDADR